MVVFCAFIAVISQLLKNQGNVSPIQIVTGIAPPTLFLWWYFLPPFGSPMYCDWQISRATLFFHRLSSVMLAVDSMKSEKK